MRRSSAWAGGVALGMIVTSVMLLPMVLGRTAFDWSPFVIGFAFIGAVPLAEYSGWLLVHTVVGVLQIRREWESTFPAATPPPAAIADNEDPITDAEWRHAAHRFLLAGTAWGFSIRTLANDRKPATKITSQDGWNAIVRVLVGAGILTTGNTGTAWAEGWDIARWKSEWRVIALPHGGQGAPRVEFPAHTQHPPRSETAPNTGNT